MIPLSSYVDDVTGYLFSEDRASFPDLDHDKILESMAELLEPDLEILLGAIMRGNVATAQDIIHEHITTIAKRIKQGRYPFGTTD